MKLVAKDTPLKYNVYFSDISEWKVCANYVVLINTNDVIMTSSLR